MYQLCDVSTISNKDYLAIGNWDGIQAPHDTAQLKILCSRDNNFSWEPPAVANLLPPQFFYATHMQTRSKQLMQPLSANYQMEICNGFISEHIIYLLRVCSLNKLAVKQKLTNDTKYAPSGLNSS
jgi:hypothetical protein